MSRLNTELLRLFLVNDAANPDQGHSVGAGGMVRAMVLELSRPAAWAELGAVWQGMQADLELPAPAIAVSGTDALQLWFSVEQPVKAQEAQAFVKGLQQRYLQDVRAKRVTAYPWTEAGSAQPTQHARTVPAPQGESGNWSAFVTPDLASVFGDEPWLDLQPNADQQADILSRVKPMTLEQFRQVLGSPGAETRTPQQTATVAPAADSATEKVASRSTVADQSPREFLLSVMNNPALDMRDRIEAAKALLLAVGHLKP